MQYIWRRARSRRARYSSVRSRMNRGAANVFLSAIWNWFPACTNNHNNNQQNCTNNNSSCNYESKRTIVSAVQIQKRTNEWEKTRVIQFANTTLYLLNGLDWRVFCKKIYHQLYFYQSFLSQLPFSSLLKKKFSNIMINHQQHLFLT